MKHNQDILQYIQQYNELLGYDTNTPYDYYTTLREGGEEVYRKKIGGNRWWNTIFCVVKLGDRYIGYEDVETTGDRHGSELGWEFDINSICHVQRQEKVEVVVTYEPIIE